MFAAKECKEFTTHILLSHEESKSAPFCVLFPTNEDTMRILFSYKSMHHLVSGFQPKEDTTFCRAHSVVLQKTTPVCLWIPIEEYTNLSRTFCFPSLWFPTKGYTTHILLSFQGHTIHKSTPRSCCFLTKAYFTKEYTTQSSFYLAPWLRLPGTQTQVAWPET